MYGTSNMETYITICKIDSQREFAVWLRKLKQGLCINLYRWDGEGDGREVQKGGDICIPMADSCWGLPDNNILWSNYSSIRKNLKSHSFHISALVTLYWTTATLVQHACPMAAFTLLTADWVAAMESKWPTKAKTIYYCHLNKVFQPLL